MTTIRFVDVLYFLAEIAVYVAVAWWGFTRGVPAAARWGWESAALRCSR